MSRAELVLVGLALLAGCGGDDSSDDQATSPAERSTTSALTKAEYVEQVDEICKQGDAFAKSADRKLEAARTEAHAAEILADEIPRQTALIDRYASIEPPTQERNFHKQFLESIRAQTVLAERAQEALEDGDQSRASTLADEARDISTKRDGLVAGHGGFEHCGDEGE